MDPPYWIYLAFFKLFLKKTWSLWTQPIILQRIHENIRILRKYLMETWKNHLETRRRLQKVDYMGSTLQLLMQSYYCWETSKETIKPQITKNKIKQSDCSFAPLIINTYSWLTVFEIEKFHTVNMF